MPAIAPTLDEALAPITDGCVLAVPRESSGVAMAATRALIRRGVRHLTLITLPTSSLQADLLIGAGCVTAIETALQGRFKLTLRKDLRLDYPRAETPTHYMTMAMDPDLDQCVVRALRDMIVLIGEKRNLSREDAYTLCSLAADLRVTQTVNGSKGIHCMIAKAIVHG